MDAPRLAGRDLGQRTGRGARRLAQRSGRRDWYCIMPERNYANPKAGAEMPGQ